MKIPNKNNGCSTTGLLANTFWMAKLTLSARIFTISWNMRYPSNYSHYFALKISVRNTSGRD